MYSWEKISTSQADVTTPVMVLELMEMEANVKNMQPRRPFLASLALRRPPQTAPLPRTPQRPPPLPIVLGSEVGWCWRYRIRESSQKLATQYNLTNIATENPPLIDEFPGKASIHRKFCSPATFHYRRVNLDLCR